MRSYSVKEARANLSELVTRALDGEPQRVTRRGREAVVVVSEAEWNKRAPKPERGLGHVLLELGEAGLFDDEVFERPDWMNNAPERDSDFT